MEEVVQLLNEPINQQVSKTILETRNDKSQQRDKIIIGDVLPCYFFDFMVGTSTGGLIAVMLGRLRMGVDDCIKGYWQLSNVIFRVKRRYFGLLYSSTKLKNAIIKVVSKHCHCHDPSQQCTGHEEEFRQYDYAEKGEPAFPARRNLTCKVAVVSQRKGNPTRETYLWRTYSHHARCNEGENLLELNSKSLHEDKAKIWEVCRATTAAPFFFKKIKIDQHKHMDGGVGNNNPADLAWHEAAQMYSRDDPQHGRASLLLSLGTGQSKVESRFGKSFLSLMFWAKNGITETEGIHRSATAITNLAHAKYIRFNVPSELSDIKISQCKKRAIKPFMPSWITPTPEPDPEDTPEWYTGLRNDAAETEAGSFKPEKYHYSTYEQLFQRTRRYYEGDLRYDDKLTVRQAIKECAETLVYCARLRQKVDPERWRQFVSHPNPSNPQSVQAVSALP